MKTFDELNYYELLEIPPDASVFEIRHAYKDQLAIYEKGAVGTYSLFGEDERDRILHRLETAFHTLLDETSRAVYDKKLIGAGQIDPGVLSRQRPKKPLPIFQAVRSTAKKHVSDKIDAKLKEIQTRQLIEKLNRQPVISGVDLGYVRGVMGIELIEIFEVLRISVSILDAIEQHREKDLPSPVFLKGFLKSYAGLFDLDSEKLMAGFGM